MKESMNVIAGNNRISRRQAFCLFFMDLLGPVSLLVPSAVAGRSGMGGGIILLIGAALSFMVLQIVLRACHKEAGGICPGVARILTGLVGLLTGGVAAYYFVRLMVSTLVKDSSYGLVLGLLLLLSGYMITPQPAGTAPGDMVERRARVYELLFIPVLVGLFFALLLAIPDMQLEYVKKASLPNFSQVVEGAYLMFLCHSGMLYLPLFAKKVAGKGKAFAIAMRQAFALALATVMVLYLVLVGTFGGPALAKMKWPAVTLMSTIQFDGTFVKRLDAFMVGIWFGMLYAVLNVNVFVARQLLVTGKKRAKGPREDSGARWRQLGITGIVLVLIFVEAMWMNYDENARNIIRIIYYTIVGPLMVLIPLLFLTGCKATELENRVFPLAIYVQWKEEGGAPGQVGVEMQLPRLKTEPDSPNLARPDATQEWYGKDFGEGLFLCEQSLDMEVDYNHLKVLILEEGFAADQRQMERLLAHIQGDNTFPRNTYVCVTKDMEELLAYEQDTQDMGSFLEGMLRKQAGEEKHRLPTLGKLMDEQANQYEKIKLPVILVNDSTILVYTPSEKEEEANEESFHMG